MNKQKIQIVTMAQGQVLLLQFAKFYSGGFQNITGSVEEGEDFLQAAIRELQEETGIAANLIDINLTFTFRDRWGFDVVEKVFLCKLTTLPAVRLSEEHQSFKWVPFEKITPADFTFPSNYEAFKKALEFYV